MTDWLTKIVPAVYRYSGAARVLSHPIADGAFLAAFFAYKRHVEDPFAALARKRPDLFAGGDILDVGANAGYTATVFARVASPGAHVHAFEPEPTNFRRLERVIRTRTLTEVVIPHRVAVGETDGSVDLAINPTHPGDHRVVSSAGQRASSRRIRVPVITLDAFENVAFVKIDTQGFELEVSRGMSRLLDRSPSITVAFEYAPSELADAKALLEFYRSRGFALHLLTSRGELRPFRDEEVAQRVASRGYVDLLATRGR